MTQVGLLRRGADSEGVLVFVAEDDLILSSATATTALRCFRLPRFCGGFGPRTVGMTGTLVVAVTLMGS